MPACTSYTSQQCTVCAAPPAQLLPAIIQALGESYKAAVHTVLLWDGEAGCRTVTPVPTKHVPVHTAHHPHAPSHSVPCHQYTQ
jgi:hypothetical protein